MNLCKPGLTDLVVLFERPELCLCVCQHSLQFHLPFSRLAQLVLQVLQLDVRFWEMWQTGCKQQKISFHPSLSGNEFYYAFLSHRSNMPEIARYLPKTSFPFSKSKELKKITELLKKCKNLTQHFRERRRIVFANRWHVVMCSGRVCLVATILICQVVGFGRNGRGAWRNLNR